MNEYITYSQRKMLPISHNSVIRLRKEVIIGHQKKIHTKTIILDLFFKTKIHERSVIHSQNYNPATK